MRRVWHVACLVPHEGDPLLSADALRILLAEATLVAEAFAALLSARPGLEVVAHVNRGDHVLPAVREHEPDLVLLEVDLPGATGIEVAAALAAEAPECRVLLLTAVESSGYLYEAMAAGASGYLLKSTTVGQLVHAIKTVAAGGFVVDPVLAANALRLGPSPLTEREADVVRLCGEGYSTAEVAERLFLARGTVRNYLSSAIRKLKAGNRVEAHLIGRRHGWV